VFEGTHSSPEIVSVQITEATLSKAQNILALLIGYSVRFPLDAWMDVCIPDMFVLPRVGAYLATGLIPRPRTSIYKINISELINNE
jgi:hypothetical protein